MKRLFFWNYRAYFSNFVVVFLLSPVWQSARPLLLTYPSTFFPPDHCLFPGVGGHDIPRDRLLRWFLRELHAQRLLQPGACHVRLPQQHST